jgi:hypothetical protein
MIANSQGSGTWQTSRRAAVIEVRIFPEVDDALLLDSLDDPVTRPVTLARPAKVVHCTKHLLLLYWTPHAPISIPTNPSNKMDGLSAFYITNVKPDSLGKSWGVA